jgi:hypothetical protein
MEGLDVSRGLRVVAERLAECAHGLGQRRVGDERVLPHAVDQLLAWDDVARAAEEDLEHADDAGWERQFLSRSAQHPAHGVEGVRPECQVRKAV